MHLPTNMTEFTKEHLFKNSFKPSKEKTSKDNNPNPPKELAIQCYWWEPNVTHPSLFRVDFPISALLPNKVEHLFPLINFPMIPNGPNIAILVKSIGVWDEGIAYNIGIGISMKVIYEDYAKRLDCGSDQIMLFFNGKFIHPWHTALAVGFTGNDIIYVISQNPLMNVNTHVKQFTIEEMCTRPRTLHYKADKLLRCVYLLHGWAEAMDVDPCRVTLVCNNSVICELATVEDMKIANGERLLAFIDPLPKYSSSE